VLTYAIALSNILRGSNRQLSLISMFLGGYTYA